MPFFGVAALVAIILLVRHLQKRFFLVQYLFFCRFPILLGLFIGLILPAALVTFGRDMIGNLGVLGPWHISLVALVATLAAWVVMFSIALLLDWIPYKARLGFYRTPSRFGRQPAHARAPKERRAQGPWRWLRTRPHVWTHQIYSACRFPDHDRWTYRPALFLLLAVFLIGVVVWKSAPLAREGGIGFLGRDAGRLLKNLGRAALGVGAAFGLRFLSAGLARPLSATWATHRPEVPHQWALQKLRSMSPRESPERILLGRARTAAPATLLSRVRGAVGFLLLWYVLYFTGYWCFHPVWASGGPSLLLILILAVIVGLALTLAAAFLDTFRVPVLLLIAVLVGLDYRLSGVDHYYSVTTAAAGSPPASAPPSPQQAYEAWRSSRAPGPSPVLVVVTASGGGITAARWTAEVLTRIQDATPRFGESLVFLSTVSGGGLGALYFVDAYRDGRAPDGKVDLERLRDQAGRSSLSATAWGIVYRDIWQGLHILDETRDRGWALEQSWIRRMQDKEATLRRWAGDAGAGRRPIQIFNTTEAETGERLLLAPMSLMRARGRPEAPGPCAPEDGPGGAVWRVKNFLDAHPGADMPIATAVRLSATFPFVSPMARPAAGAVPDGAAYHLGDGGYYDNHGVVSAIDFLRDVLPAHFEMTRTDPGTRPKVILIQIRASELRDRPARSGHGFRYATFGPIDALLNVRTTSQALRDDMDVDFLQSEWAGRVDVLSFTFTLRDADAPLSWHLTRDDIAHIVKGWTREHDDQLRCIKDALEAG
ncbi:MAG TPA: hypothetical protein VGV60_12505 [Candidatus Polarisedimenticolia bacterium]|jgi:hypothetical protein|nr:hypothetical protein [Candidatus Polarisedimenticolia bacterium]